MATPRTSFLILSDTHNFESDDAPDDCPLKQSMPKVDVLLHCGDLTQVGGLPQYKRALRFLGTFDAELKLVIAGNHDISLDGNYWHSHLDEGDAPAEHDQAVEIMTGPLAKEMGVTYLTEGTHTFTLKSGVTFTIYASPYSREFCDWAFAYPMMKDRFNCRPADGMMSIASNPVPEGVDIIMTHGPPSGILDYVERNSTHAGCDAVRRAAERTKPLLHCFGHIHEGHGSQLVDWPPASPGRIQSVSAPKAFDFTSVATVTEAGTGRDSEHHNLARGQSTLFVNAAIMDNDNKPMNAQLIVELPLRVPNSADNDYA